MRLTLGNLTGPAITSLKYLPGRNTDTFVFLTASPVRGLPAERAALARFSKTPNPKLGVTVSGRQLTSTGDYIEDADSPGSAMAARPALCRQTSRPQRLPQ